MTLITREESENDEESGGETYQNSFSSGKVFLLKILIGFDRR
jgi:hypothetical protein